MKLRTLLFLAGISVLVACVFFACSSTSAAVTPIGNATGTATGTAPGFGGEITVTVTLADGIITDVVVTGDGESPTIGGPAILRAPNLIKRYNSAQFDAVSGATITCTGVSIAAQAAIDKIVSGGDSE